MKTFEEILAERKKKKGTITSVSSNSTRKSFDEILAERNIKRKKNDLGPVDIAGTENGTDEREWFQKSALFDDGWDKGDVTKTVAASGTDVAENAGAGFIGVGEKLVDAFFGLGTLMNAQAMNEAVTGEITANFLSGKNTSVDTVLENYENAQNLVEKEASEFIKQDLYDEAEIARKIITDPLEKAWDINVETDSVFGEKSDELAQSAGQLGATALVNAIAPGSGLVMTGVTAFGGEMESALNQGATYDEAVFSSAVSAGAEILTEKLTGGIKFGGKALDDALTSKITSSISNSVVRKLADLGMDAAGEGFEEVLSGAMSAVGQKLSYMSDKELTELFSSEDAWDSFVGGAVLGGLSNAGGNIKAKMQGVDSVTGLSKNEQAVFDKVYNDRLAEAKEGGKKVSGKKKSEIFNSVMNDIEKGYVGIDTIESVLGGETYKQYQSAVEKDNQMKELRKEYDSLYKMKNGEKSDEQIDRQKELKQQLEEYKNTSNMSQLKEQLSNEVSELAKTSKLSESYNEKTRKSQAFEANLSKYDAKAQETVKRAIDSGILNNTNRTHEFVDLVAKLSADKGVPFDFTNNEKIKASGFAIEGKQVNGYVQGNNIAINIDSTSALNKVVGHEITHILEGTEIYTELANVVKQYATTKGEYDSKLQSIAKLYEGIEDANIENELTADLIGEYLFTDPDFVNSLSAEQPTLFQKIFDEIKYLCKVATAGSKEAKQLEKVKKTFADAYKQKNNTATDDGVKYQIKSYMTDIERSEILKEKQIKLVDFKTANFEKAISDNPQLLDKKLKTTDAKKLLRKIGAEFGVFDKYSNPDIEIEFEFGKNNLDESVNKQKGNYDIYTQMLSCFSDVITNAIGVEVHNRNAEGYKVDRTLENVYVLFSAFENDTDIVPVKLEIKEFLDKPNRLYVAVALEGIKKDRVESMGVPNIRSHVRTSPVNISISDLLQKINPKDVDFLKYIPNELLTDEQIKAKTNFEYNRAVKNNDLTKAQELVDEAAERAGYTIKAFHGSDKFFTVFDKGNKTSQAPERSHFFTSNKSVAHSYTGYKKDVNLDLNAYPIYKQATREGNVEENRVTHGGVYSVFLKMNNPYIVDFNGEYYSHKIEGMDINEIVQFAQENNYDGVIAKNIKDPGDMGDENWNEENSRVVADDYIVFESTQVKSAETVTHDEKGNVIPLSERFNEANNDIRYSLTDNNDIAPVGNGNVYGEDIKLQPASAEDIDPVEQSAETTETVEEKPKSKRLERAVRKIDTQLEQDKADLSEDFQQKKAELEKALENKTSFVSDKALSLYKEIQNLRKGVRASNDLGYFLDLGFEWKDLKSTLLKVSKWPDTVLNAESEIESIVREAIGRDFEEKFYELDDLDTEYQKQIEELEKKAEEKRKKAGVAEQRRVKQQEYKTQMDELIGDTSTWKDKKLGVQYQINTLRRNLRDIVRDKNGKRDLAKADAIYDELQGQYNHNEAELNREANRIKQVYAEMNITKAEDTYTQMLGEYRHNPDTKLTLEEVQEFLEKNRDKIDQAKVDKIIDLARGTYDSLFGRTNAVLKEQGMREIPYRLGYFPHFTEEKQGKLAKLLNWKTHKTDIPTDIAGLTEQFNPNRSWQSFNKQRSGDDTDYSFMKGLDTYVQGSLDWIYHIEDIQKRRAFENHIRYVHSEKGIQEKIDAIYNNEEYDADEMQEQVDAVFKEAGNPLNNFVTDFRTQTNTLAGKKSSMDRNMEAMLSRDVYSTMTNISNRVTANMVVGSVSSALTNFIPITQSWGQVSPISSLRAMKDTIKSTIQDDGTIDKSDFLTNRLKKTENLYKTTWDKVIDKAGFMMEAIDSFTSQTVWRSKYFENVSKGMGENEAIKDADQFAENVLAGRSRGNNPTIFDSKNPLIKTMTAFQLEVNNQYGYMFKDMPQDMKNESVAKLVKGYATMFIGAYAYNAAYSALTGRDAAFDPIGIIQELLQDLFDDEEDEPADVIMDFTDNIIDELPFVGGILGDGGRVPLSSALPYDDGIYGAFEGTVTDLTEGDLENLTKEWLSSAGAYLLLPAGGGQIKKTVQGLSMFDDDLPIAGSYTDSGKLRFTVDDAPLNIAQAAVFGQYSSDTARQYFDEERAPLSDKKTQELIDLDIPIEEYWEYQDGLKALGEDATLAEKVDYIADLEEFDTWQKNIMANNLTDRETPIDLTDYDKYGDFEELDFAVKYPEKYAILQEQGISVKEYKEKYEESVLMYTDDFSWASQNAEKYTLSKAVTNDVMEYKRYTSELYNIKADKDKNGKSISGSKKEKVINYINNLDIEYGEKIILYRSQYKSDDTYNYEIVEYLNGRDDISREEMETILTELGFTVYADGRVTW